MPLRLAGQRRSFMLEPHAGGGHHEVGVGRRSRHPAGSRAVARPVQTKAQALARAQAAVVGVRATAVEDARSNESLGREREGSGVVIGTDGLVLTIGYLILEADHVELVLGAERVIPARVVAYDLASGFALLQGLVPVRVPPVRMGESSAIALQQPLMIASGGEDGESSLARLVSRRAFSGYWEYHVDGALFTAPPRTDHSGAGLFNADGELLGIGSLVVMDALGPDHPRMPGNMFVPIDLLKSILPELRQRGASRGSTRAWLGLNCVEVDGMVRVVRTSPDGPAEQAGLLPGDRILRIDGVEVNGLEGLYKTLWRGSSPEREVSLLIQRGGEQQNVKLQSQDRTKLLRRAKGI
ncbi:MAG: serine protease [Betaproteobacteria bacterium]|nr:MAG: serine protease [Betaproteobacteria bacterium]